MRMVRINDMPVYVRGDVVGGITESQIQQALQDKKIFGELFLGIGNVAELQLILEKFPQHAADIIRGIFDNEQCVKI